MEIFYFFFHYFWLKPILIFLLEANLKILNIMFCHEQYFIVRLSISLHQNRFFFFFFAKILIIDFLEMGSFFQPAMLYNPIPLIAEIKHRTETVEN